MTNDVKGGKEWKGLGQLSSGSFCRIASPGADWPALLPADADARPSHQTLTPPSRLLITLTKCLSSLDQRCLLEAQRVLKGGKKQSTLESESE